MLFFPICKKVSSQGHTVNAGIFFPAPARNITGEKGPDMGKGPYALTHAGPFQRVRIPA